MAFPLPNPGDLIDLVLKIKSTIDTVIDNDGKLRSLADELHDSVRSLLHCTNNYRKLPKSQTNTFLAQFNHALRALRHDLLQSLEHCQSLARVGTTGQFTTIRSRVYSWWNRDQIAGEIQQIQRKVEHHFRMFSMWGLTAATGAVGSLQADVRACHDLLKSINGRLSETIRKAALDPSEAARLISASAMDGAKLRSNLARAMKELQYAGPGSPKHQYLQLKTRTLQALLGRHSIPKQHQHPPSDMENSTVVLLTNHSPADREREDPVLHCLDSLHSLGANDRYPTHVPEETFLSKLDYLSTCLCRTDLAGEAVKVIERLVPIYDGRNRTNPDCYLPRLAIHLNNRSVALLRTSQSSQRALLDIAEATKVYRTLVARDPRFQQSLATVLNNLSYALSLQGCHKESLDAMEECLRIRRSVALPHTLCDSFSHSIRHFSDRLTRLANKNDALVFSARAAHLVRPLSAELFDTFAPALAASLHSKSTALGHLQRYEEGLSVANEVVDIYTRLSERDHRGMHRRDLELALSSLAHFRQVVTHRSSSIVSVNERSYGFGSAGRGWQYRRQDRCTTHRDVHTRHFRHNTDSRDHRAHVIQETRFRTQVRRERYVHYTSRSERAY